MKHFETNSLFWILPIVIMSVIAITALPSAFANTPSIGGGSFVTGSDATISLQTPFNSGILSRGQQIQVVDDTPAGSAFSGGAFPCPIVLADYGTAAPIWQLEDGAGKTIGYDVGPGNGDIVTVSFGPSGTSGTVTALGAAKVYVVTGPLGPGATFLTVASGPSAVPTPNIGGGTYSGSWVTFQVPTAENTNRIGLWAATTCGYDNPPSVGSPYKSPGQFTIAAPVAGTILPIDMTSLVLAGMLTSGLWLLPTIGFVTAAGLVIYRFRK